MNSEKILSQKVIFKAQQGQPIQIEFTATDDESPTGANDPTLELIEAPSWLKHNQYISQG